MRIATLVLIGLGLANCTGAVPSLLAPGGSPNIVTASSQPEWLDDVHDTTGSSYKILFRFNGADGEYPNGGMVAIKGALFGTAGDTNNYGIVFKVTTSGHESVLYSFEDAANGSGPDGIIDLNGELYGTTAGGGVKSHACPQGCGTVFKLSLSGVHKVLYNFKGGKDGSEPTALIALNGTLYGTTLSGGDGACECGTVFSITTTGTERVLHRFLGYPHDGASPQAGLVPLNGTMYGTTVDGGSHCVAYYTECGTVFKISSSGNERLLHSFYGGSDGANPHAPLIAVNGVLFGTTGDGGSYECGCGTVFSITTSGRERVIHRFKLRDGSYPGAPLTVLNGTLYGTTLRGGDSRCGNSAAPGCGVIFAMSDSGKETVLHRFSSRKDGAYPTGSLTALSGKIYGTSSSGGSSARPPGYGYYGYGTVFEVSP